LFQFFSGIFVTKTGNDWETREDFEPVKGRFNFVSKFYEDKKNKPERGDVMEIDVGTILNS